MLNVLIVSAQIDFQYNSPRAGDEIIKQQIEYKDPGRSGPGLIWDFSKLKTINERYSLIYSRPYLVDKSVYIMGKDTILAKDIDIDNLLIGTEHNTMYYYRINDQRLLLLGHENPTTLLHYTKPLLAGVYPTNYNENHKGDYSSKGTYSSRSSFETKGDVGIQADAYGMMVLPGNDTLKQVLRVKTVQTITETGNNQSAESKDMQTTLESYKWYTKGYRYPVFEIVRTRKDTNMPDTTDSKVFETAFYFPLQDHFYLDNDPDNMSRLDSLWNIQQKDIEKHETKQLQEYKLKYNCYPNPVETNLTIEYELEETTPVSITLFDMEGKRMRTQVKTAQQEGVYKEILDCSNLAKGTYILRINTNKDNVNEKIVKK